MERSLHQAAACATFGAALAVASAIAYSRWAAPSGDDDEDQERRLDPAVRRKPPSRPSKNRREINNSSNVTTIVLTGGPCGGKSTCLNQIVKRLQENQYQVFIAPEMPTFLRQQCTCPFPFVPQPSVYDAMHMLSWEGNKMQIQLHLEEALFEIACSSGLKTVIICDRGKLRDWCDCDVIDVGWNGSGERVGFSEHVHSTSNTPNN